MIVDGRRTKMSEHMGFEYPSDGLTPEEKAIERTVAELSLHEIYGRLPNNKLKALVAMHFELGYPQDMLAKVFGVDQSMISRELEIVRMILKGKAYRPHKPKAAQVNMTQVMEVLLLLGQE
jgi:hypothetical protein